MNIQFASDLHLEFPENRLYYRAHPLTPVGDILVLAGDIVPFIKMEKYRDFFMFCSDNFRQTYWLPGNHEYYKSDISSAFHASVEKVQSNVFLVNNQVFPVEEITIIFSTLWTPISAIHAQTVQQFVADYRYIRQGSGFFTTESSALLFKNNIGFIKRSVAAAPGKCVVVTHHVPTLRHYPQKFAGSPYNDAFVVELEDYIKFSSIDFWIFGHHHYNVDNFVIGKTTLATNQLGYISRGEQKGFSDTRMITL